MEVTEALNTFSGGGSPANRDPNAWQLYQELKKDNPNLDYDSFLDAYEWAQNPSDGGPGPVSNSGGSSTSNVYYDPSTGTWYYNDKVGQEVWWEGGEVYVRPHLRRVYLDFQVDNTDQAGDQVGDITSAISVTASATQSTLQSTKIGSNIAYKISNNKLLLQSSKVLKPLGYVGVGFSVPYDIYLSNTGQQSWSETILNSTISISAVLIGGWYGLGMVGLYSLGQVGYEATMEGLEKGVIKPNPDLTTNYVGGLAPSPVSY